ncbi:AbrB family transcriptional regulator [Seohaeicola saemankumensis]|nr:AbrB family transcriptional regulator [Seohaeicola saemankumensis]MCA0872016.1 AbrB family transcriptional regulator [Seohaeicola saemankumensis]
MTASSVPLWLTLRSVAIGACGGAVAYALSMPAAVLIGPALAVSCAGLAGIEVRISDRLRDLCFVFLGTGIGSGFTADAGNAILRWPLAFVALFVMLIGIIGVGRAVLVRGFGFDRRSAALSVAPGHLSFVMSLATDTHSNVGRVAVVQSIRLLALTVSVPFVAMAMGYKMGVTALPGGTPMIAAHWIALAVLGALAGLGLKRLRLPAPMLLGSMTVSALGHVTDVTPGTVPLWLTLPAFLGLGTLIGTRFSGMSMAQFRAALLAGLTVTAISVAIAAVAAVPVAYGLQMPLAHVLTAFSPGGLETMVALGATMGASPGFIAACHIMRLLMLSLLIPLSLGRSPKTP